MQIMELEQGSSEWLNWRRTHRMASETPAVTRRSPYQSWEGLRDIKRGANTPNNHVMQFGHDHEAEARAWAASEVGMLFVPLVIEDGIYGASLDGMEDRVILEVKSPFQGRNSKTWKMAQEGLIRPDYDDQVIHQMATAKAELCLFCVYDAYNKKGIIIERKPDADLWGSMQKQWDEFWEWHLTDEPDPAKNVRSDNDWVSEAAIYTAAKRQAEAFAKLAEASRKTLISMAGGQSTMGGGVKVSQLEKSGSIDYKNALLKLNPEADVELFRKPSTNETRVTIL